MTNSQRAEKNSVKPPSYAQFGKSAAVAVAVAGAVAVVVGVAVAVIRPLVVAGC